MRLPNCRNPEHPHGVRKDDMVITDERYLPGGGTVSGIMIACRPCMEINKVLSHQYITLPRGWDKAIYENEIRGIEKRKLQEKSRVGKVRVFGKVDHSNAI